MSRNFLFHLLCCCCWRAVAQKLCLSIHLSQCMLRWGYGESMVRSGGEWWPDMPRLWITTLAGLHSISLICSFCIYLSFVLFPDSLSQELYFDYILHRRTLASLRSLDIFMIKTGITLRPSLSPGSSCCIFTLLSICLADRSALCSWWCVLSCRGKRAR